MCDSSKTDQMEALYMVLDGMTGLTATAVWIQNWLLLGLHAFEFGLVIPTLLFPSWEHQRCHGALLLRGEDISVW